MLKRIIFAAALAALTLPGHAQTAEEAGPSLTIGDKAPPIDIAHWLKGDKVEAFEDDKVYVLEFWATWCGPCVASMPKLSEMQEKYRDYDVTFIGISDEELPIVVDFLFKKNRSDGKMHHERTQYTLTTDPDMSVKKAYFQAAGQRGIPCAFIVGKDQHVEWLGHPMGMQAALDAVVRDTWDRDEFRREFEQARANEARGNAIMKSFRDAARAGEWEKAVTELDRIIALGEQYEGYKAQKFTILTKEMKDYDRAYRYADEIIESSWENPMMLNQLAWFIADEDGLEQRDFNRAMKAARRANELTEGKDAAILDTVARVYFETGDIDRAIIYQRKAVKFAEGPMAESLQEALERYERAANK
jgi:thiol-disulfide isomerase/thioredoxin